MVERGRVVSSLGRVGQSEVESVRARIECGRVRSIQGRVW